MPETLQTEVSGLEHGRFAECAAALALERAVNLAREPDNRWDPCAVRVETEDGLRIGYVERGMSARVARELDQQGGLGVAFVAAIEGGFYAEQPRLRLAIPIESESDPGGGRPSAYCFASHGPAFGYLLVDCGRRALAGVIEQLAPLAGPSPRFAASTKAAPDGRRYRWFVTIDAEAAGDRPEGSLEDAVDRVMEEAFGLQSHARLLREAREAEERRLRAIREFERESGEKERELRGARDEVDAYVRLADSYRGDAAVARTDEARLRARVQALESELEGRRGKIAELRRALDEARAEREAIESRVAPATTGRAAGAARLGAEQVALVLQAVCPGVRLLRNSAEVIDGLANQAPALRELARLGGPGALRGERVEGAAGWSEGRFSTGQADDGRLYWRRAGDHVDALVALKATQVRDVRYLAGA